MSKLTLDSVEWKEFFIGGKSGLFEITSTSSGIDKNKLNTKEGRIPYITRSEIDNGINLFVTDEQNVKYKKDTGNVITIGLDTQTVFYQENGFYTGQNIQVLKNEHLNKEVALFIIPLLKIQMQKFNWGGNGATLTRLNRTKVLLPVDHTGNPHWQFMEDYIKQERKKQVIQIRNYYEPKLLMLAGELAGLEEVEWKEFKFTDIFTKIQRGKRLTKGNQVEGDIPYISSTATNNGVDNFISNEEKVRKFDNCLTLANSGSVGSCFYQRYEFVASDHVTALQNKDFSKGVYLFLSSVIKRLEEKYSFNREINDARISRETVILPVDTIGNPNWQYMEDYVKRLELEQLENVLEYIYIYRTISFHRDFQKSKSVEWKEFWLEDVCEIQSGIRLTQSDMVEGERPFIGATEFNNGITAFVSNTNKSLDSNVLGVNYNGSVVKSFYHEYECIFSDDVKRLKVKDTNYQNKYIYLFLKQVILQQERKYAYGYKFNASRMKRQKIMLPVLEDGNIDFEYMIDQMKWLEFKEIFKLLSSIR
jgi:restriction endonuclease S subunit